MTTTACICGPGEACSARPCFGTPRDDGTVGVQEVGRWDEGPCYICGESVPPSEGWHREDFDDVRRHWCKDHQPVWSYDSSFHVITTVSDFLDGGWRGECACGWKGTDHVAQDEALEDARIHKAEQDGPS